MLDLEERSDILFCDPCSAPCNSAILQFPVRITNSLFVLENSLFHRVGNFGGKRLMQRMFLMQLFSQIRCKMQKFPVNSRISGNLAAETGSHGTASTTKILRRVFLKIFPSSHLGEGCRLLTGEGRFEACGGSHFGTFQLDLPVAQPEEHPATNREACRFDSCREGQFRGCSSAGRAPRLGRGGRRIVTCHPDHPYGELAERQGIAVLTRRDLRVGQVRLLHSPPICGSGIDGCASVFQTDQARSLLAARSNSPRWSAGWNLGPSNQRNGIDTHTGLQFAGMREWPNRPAFEAEVGARAPRTFKSCSRFQCSRVQWRQLPDPQHNGRGDAPAAVVSSDFRRG